MAAAVITAPVQDSGVRIGESGVTRQESAMKNAIGLITLFQPLRYGSVLLITAKGRQPKCGGCQPDCGSAYFISALAPASVSCFRMSSASFLDTASFTALGAPSTRSLASFRPRPVIARTTLMTLTLLSPHALSITVNSVCSSTAGAAAPAAAGPATATAAAADTPNFSSISLIRVESSSTVILDIASSSSALAIAIEIGRAS